MPTGGPFSATTLLSAFVPNAVTGVEARLDDRDHRLFLVDQPTEFGSRSVEGREANGSGGVVVDTGHGLVLAEVDGQNGRVLGGGCRNRTDAASSSWGWSGLSAW